MRIRRIGLLAALLGAIGIVLHVGSGWITPEIIPEWAFVRSTGTTVVLYGTVANIVVLGITISLAVAAGYWFGQRTDLKRNYRRVGAVVSAGVAIGMIATVLAFALVTFSMPTARVTLLLGFLSLFSTLLEVGLIVTLGMIVGAAYTHFSEIEENGRTGTDSPTHNVAEPGIQKSSENSDIRSEVV